MRDPEILHQGVVARDPAFYQSHPHVAVASGGDIVVVHNQVPRRSYIFHPPHDPWFRNVVTRSTDGGLTWSPGEVVPDYAATGAECAGLTSLDGGRMLLNQWRFDWLPLGLARRQAREGRLDLAFPDTFADELIQSGELDTGPELAKATEALAPWARGHGTSWVHLSMDDGRSFTRSVTVDTGPFHGGYGLRGAVSTSSGTLLLPLNDVPEWRVIFCVRSVDLGESWGSPTLIARAGGHLFTEPAMLALPCGRILCMFRDDTSRVMHQCHSDDDGHTWSEARPSGIDGYPPHLLALGDGRLLCTYASRLPELSIRAVLSEDRGKSWQRTEVIRIRGNLTNRDLGYPATVPLPESSALLTAHYCQDSEGVTGIEAVAWKVGEV